MEIDPERPRPPLTPEGRASSPPTSLSPSLSCLLSPPMLTVALFCLAGLALAGVRASPEQQGAAEREVLALSALTPQTQSRFLLHGDNHITFREYVKRGSRAVGMWGGVALARPPPHEVRTRRGAVR